MDVFTLALGSMEASRTIATCRAFEQEDLFVLPVSLRHVLLCELHIDPRRDRLGAIGGSSSEHKLSLGVTLLVRHETGSLRWLKPSFDSFEGSGGVSGKSSKLIVAR